MGLAPGRRQTSDRWSSCEGKYIRLEFSTCRFTATLRSIKQFYLCSSYKETQFVVLFLECTGAPKKWHLCKMARVRCINVGINPVCLQNVRLEIPTAMFKYLFIQQALPLGDTNRMCTHIMPGCQNVVPNNGLIPKILLSTTMSLNTAVM